MAKTYTVSGDGGTPRTGAHFVRMIHFVNGCAKGKDQEAVFGQPTILRIDGVYNEVYPRCNVQIEDVPGVDYDDNDRTCRGITFFVEDEDVELQEWLEAARAHVMGINVGKSL